MSTAAAIQIQAQEPQRTSVPLLDQRFAVLKKRLVKPEHKHDVIESYGRLCELLKQEADLIQKSGSSIVPEIDFDAVLGNDGKFPEDFVKVVRDRGCIILRGVVDEEQATAWEKELEAYTKRHSAVGGFPPDNPQNWSLWWTRPQVQIRSHPRVLQAMRVVSQLWHVADNTLPVDMASQVVYPDRFRIRYPSREAAFTLPAHQDSGAIERWEDDENRANYAAIFEGRWPDWDAWSADRRIAAAWDLYRVEPACSNWRSLQGWLSLSHTGTGEGTLRVLPSLRASVAYCMLRPLFHGNETFDDSQPTFPGSRPGNTQFRPTDELHPHLQLARSMVGIPPVRPGDYVFWHCDSIHEVDPFHPGDRNSSAVYNACNPLTPYNIESLLGVRDAFNKVVPPKDFALYRAAKQKECEHEDHGARRENILSEQGLQALGLAPFDVDEPGLSEGQRAVRALANEKLGFA